MDIDEKLEIINHLIIAGIYLGATSERTDNGKLIRFIHKLRYQLPCVHGRVQTIVINSQTKVISGDNNFCEGCEVQSTKGLKKCFQVYTSSDLENMYSDGDFAFDKDGQIAINNLKDELELESKNIKMKAELNKSA